MSAYKDGNKYASILPNEPLEQSHDMEPKEPSARAAKALFEGCCLDENTDPERVAEYEKNWKEGQKV